MKTTFSTMAYKKYFSELSQHIGSVAPLHYHFVHVQLMKENLYADLLDIRPGIKVSIMHAAI